MRINVTLFVVLLAAGWNTQVARCDYRISADKGLDEAWVQSLFEKGQRKVYRGEELEPIGMPCGGIGAGQLYVRGDGTLAQWWIFNHWIYTGEGQPKTVNTPLGAFPVGIRPTPVRPPSPVEQGFAIGVKTRDDKTMVRQLSRDDFDNIGFIGEYPIATILYEVKDKPALPVSVQAEVFSPWIPLNTRDSANPATILSYTVTNTSSEPVEVSIGGWLMNAVWLGQDPKVMAERRNRVAKGDRFVAVQMDLCEPAAGDTSHLVAGADVPFPSGHAQLGDMSLAALGSQPQASATWESKEAFLNGLTKAALPSVVEGKSSLAEQLCGTVTSRFELEAGEKKMASFLVTWYFPNHVLGSNNPFPEKGTLVGHVYANWYSSSVEVADYLADNFDRLSADTHLFRDTYFDTTLPYWLMQRINMPTSTLASDTCQWWRNGRFWAWEAAGFCFGTCGHVFNHVQTIARLFPELERSVRLMQDLGPNGLDEPTGRVDFRGGNSNSWKVGRVDGRPVWGYAADAQAGYVLKLYREHLMSPDGKFLNQVWPRTKKVIGYLIERDAAGRDSENRRADLSKADGAIEDCQHTWDANLWGANGYVGVLYLAALRAAEEMAKVQGEGVLAERYHSLYESGRGFVTEQLWDGEYFVHQVDEEQRGRMNPQDYGTGTFIEYGNGCLAEQLMGQHWARQLGLGELLSTEQTRQTLASIYRYNFAPDGLAHQQANMTLGPTEGSQYTTPRPVQESEGGMFFCTWPKSEGPVYPPFHSAEVWTGTQFQVAGHMLYEGMADKALVILRYHDDRWNVPVRNPWNEIEGGEHYVRSLASWSCLLGASGYIYDGPAGNIGFAPRLTPEDFKCFFSGAQGWGSLVQQRQGKVQTNAIEVKWGRLRVKSLVLELPEAGLTVDVRVQVAGDTVGSQVAQDGRRITVALAREVVVEAGQRTEVVMCWE